MNNTKKRGPGRPRKNFNSNLDPSLLKEIKFPVAKKNVSSVVSKTALVASSDNVSLASLAASIDLVDTVADVASVKGPATSNTVDVPVTHILNNDNPNMNEIKKRGRGRPRKILDSNFNSSSSNKTEFPVVKKNAFVASEVAFVKSVDNVTVVAPSLPIVSTNLVDATDDTVSVSSLDAGLSFKDSSSCAKPKKPQTNLLYFSLTFEGLDKHHVRPCLDHVLLGLGIRRHVSKYVSCFANENLCILIILEKRLNVRCLSFLTFENRSPVFTYFNKADRGFRFVLKDFKPNFPDDSYVLSNVSLDELVAYDKITTVSTDD